jgi:hypothetical protein
MFKWTLLMALTLSISLVAFMSGATTPSLPANDRVSTSMSNMRLVAFTLDAFRREHGAVPFADGQLRPFTEVLAVLEPAVAVRSAALDGWGRPILFRANADNYQLISFGSDGQPERDYANEPLYSWRHQPIIEASREGADLVLVDGRFVQRPFGDRKAAFLTVNAMNSIFVACESYAVDNNQYPSSGPGLVPVTALTPHLVPIYLASLPDADGWGRPMLASSDDRSITLVSFGSDGILDMPSGLGGACGLEGYGGGPSAAAGADIIQACGHFTHWVAGTEP